MKIKDEVDLNTIITTVAFIVVMVIWGIRLEDKVSGNSSGMQAKAESIEQLMKLRWETIDSRMDRLRADITLVEQQLRETKQ